MTLRWVVDQVLEALGGLFHLLLRWMLLLVASFSTPAAFLVSPVVAPIYPIVSHVSPKAPLFLLAQGKLVSWVS